MNAEVDVLFVYTNINGFHLDTYSFGIGYLSSVLKEAGFRTKLEVVKSRKDYRHVLKSVTATRPKIIGFSSVSSQFVFVSDLAKMIKKIHKCIVVCGGVHPTIFPDCLLRAPRFDGIFMGESEFSFLDFVSEVTKGNPYKEVDNFCYADKDKLIKNKLRPRIQNLAELPFPDRDIYDYQAVINENGGFATILTSRGCPFNCTYCSNHAIRRIYEKERNDIIRQNSIEKTLAEIDMLKSRYTFERLYFIDDLFILNRSWIDRFLSEYKKRFDIPFLCHIRPDVCTREMLFKLKEAGCYMVFIAVESANDHIRNTIMKRNITRERLRNAFEWSKEAGLLRQSVNIIGVPTETEETVLETINFNRQVNPEIVGVNIFSPYEGTELGDYCRKEGLLVEKDAHSFFDRRQSRLNLPDISNKNLMNLFNKFEYLIYKDTNPLRAKKIIWRKRYEKLEKNMLFGYLFRKSRKLAKAVAGKILRDAQ